MAARSPREAAQRTKDIREAVKKELEFDPLVDASDITVKNMNGDVALNGTVPRYPQYLHAAAAAKRVQGVTRVHNHLMVDLAFADYRDDALLTTDANNALAMSVSVPGNVEASASEGDVWLTGMVGNRFERDAAEQAIARLPGVRGIVDDIEIFSDIEAADTMDLVQGALDRYGLLPGDTDVRVAASDGTVTITGHVETWGEHDAVIDAAWRGVGVKNVRDDLVVTGLPDRLSAFLILGEHGANPTAGRRPAVGLPSERRTFHGFSCDRLHFPDDHGCAGTISSRPR